MNNSNHHPVLGISYMAIGTLFFSMSDALGKWLTAIYPIIQISWIRSVLGIVIIVLYAVFSHRREQLRTSKPGWHLARSILSTGVMLGIFYGLKYLPLTEFVSIVFAAPFIIALLSPRFLNEPVASHSWLAIIIGFTGILIVLRPTPSHFHMAHLATLAVAASIAFLVLTARRLSTSESPVALNFYIYPFNIVVCFYWAVSDWVMPSATDWLLFIALGASSTAALVCFLQAMRYAQPAVVAPMDYIRIIWTALISYYIWQEIPDAFTWLGIAVIVASGMYIVSHGKSIPEIGVGQNPGEDQ